MNTSVFADQKKNPRQTYVSGEEVAQSARVVIHVVGGLLLLQFVLQPDFRPEKPSNVLHRHSLVQLANQLLAGRALSQSDVRLTLHRIECPVNTTAARIACRRISRFSRDIASCRGRYRAVAYRADANRTMLYRARLHRFALRHIVSYRMVSCRIM